MEKSTDENFEKLIEEMEKEQPTEEVKQEEAYYAHVELMKEEGLEKSDMPDHIRKMITQFEQKRTQIERSNDADKMADLQQLSSMIEGKIVNHLDGNEEFEEGGEIEEGSEIGEGGDSEEVKVEQPKKSSEWGILGGIFDW